MNNIEEYTLFGLDKQRTIIEDIINDMNCTEYSFDIELILSEALSNAFIHGNKRDTLKPIFISYEFIDKSIRFIIKDCGPGIIYEIPTEVSEEDLLKENGRGLFLIKSFADKVEFKDNMLIIEKNILK